MAISNREDEFKKMFGEDCLMGEEHNIISKEYLPVELEGVGDFDFTCSKCLQTYYVEEY